MRPFSAIKQFIEKKRFLRDATYVYLGSVANGVSLFLINVVLGRVLSKEWYGVFTLSVLALSTVAEMSDFGLNAGLLRFSPYYIATNQTEKLKQLVKTIWRWRVSLTVILTIGGLLVSYPVAVYILKQPSTAPYLAFSFLGIGGVVLLGFVTTYLQSQQRFFYQANVQFLKGTLRLFLVGLFAILHITNLYFYLFVYIFVPWILFALNYYVLPQGFQKVVIEDSVRKELNSQLARFSFWLTLSSLMAIFSSRIDQVMVSRYLGLEEVAIYAAAYQLIQLFPIIQSSISSVLTPRMNSLTSNDDIVRFINRSLKWIIALVIVVSVFVYPSKFLITLFWGHKYDASMPVYLVLAFSILFNLISIPFSLAITAFNKTELSAFSSILQLILNLGLTVVLIPKFGVIGAAYTFAIGILTSLVYNVICSIYLIRTKKIKIV